VDDRDVDGTTSQTVSIANESPTVTSATTSNQYPKPGDNLTLTCNATDPEGDTLSYQWSPTWGSGSISGQVVNQTFLASGDQGNRGEVATCEAKDVCGNTATKSVNLNNGQSVSDGTTCSNNFSNGALQVSINLDDANVDFDLELTDPSSNRTWYGHIRPGNSSELCVDVVCSTAGSKELIYFPSGFTLNTVSSYTIKVHFKGSCTGPTSSTYDLTITTTGAFQIENLTASGGPTVACTSFPLTTCTESNESANLNDTHTWTLDLQ
jgi:hypothetical protein